MRLIVQLFVKIVCMAYAEFKKKKKTTKDTRFYCSYQCTLRKAINVFNGIVENKGALQRSFNFGKLILKFYTTNF